MNLKDLTIKKIKFIGDEALINLVSIKVNKYPTKARVERVIDGDTIQFASDKISRFNGINCPEKKKDILMKLKILLKKILWIL